MTEGEKLRLAQEQSQSQWKKETEAKAKADKDQKSAQAAARLDQVISSPSVKKAVDTKSAQVASRLESPTQQQISSIGRNGKHWAVRQERTRMQEIPKRAEHWWIWGPVWSAQHQMQHWQ